MFGVIVFVVQLPNELVLKVIVIGNENDDCNIEYDERWKEMNRELSKIYWNVDRTHECPLIHQYIAQSQVIKQNKDRVVNVRIPFRAYSDTFWNIGSGDDENSGECQQCWGCNIDRKKQCVIEQCMPSEWLGGGDWNCVDAFDELHCLKVNTRTELKRVSKHHAISELTWVNETCHSASSYICLSPHSTGR